MKLYRFRKELKKLIQYDLFHEHSFKEIVLDPFIYVILFFLLSGVYVGVIIIMSIISLFIK